jgi:hypothetical protein
VRTDILLEQGLEKKRVAWQMSALTLVGAYEHIVSGAILIPEK